MINSSLLPARRFPSGTLCGAQIRKQPIKMGMFCLTGGSSFCRGGGLCQMSSFLYWLFLHTPLTITEQHTHGIDLHLNMPGIPQGIDAAVSEGWLDLTVKNNTAHTFQLLVAVDSHNMSGMVLSDTRLRPVYQKQIS